eukprot:1187678-Prorocentrum_minimum.AAC.7
MRACTAALVELSYNEDPSGSPYTGEVEFVSPEEWEKELDLLFDDLTQQDGRVRLAFDRTPLAKTLNRRLRQSPRFTANRMTPQPL